MWCYDMRWFHVAMLWGEPMRLCYEELPRGCHMMWSHEVMLWSHPMGLCCEAISWDYTMRLAHEMGIPWSDAMRGGYHEHNVMSWGDDTMRSWYHDDLTIPWGNAMRARQNHIIEVACKKLWREWSIVNIPRNYVGMWRSQHSQPGRYMLLELYSCRHM